MTDITVEAIGKWRAILIALGVDEKFLTGKHGPCPMCEGKDRFRFTDHEGRGGWVCNQCGRGDGFKLIEATKGVGFREAVKLVNGVIHGCAVSSKPPTNQAELLARAAETWKVAKPWQGSIVETYLASRLIATRPWGRIRFVPGAMLAGVQAPDGKLATLHRTFLKPDGSGKADVPVPRKTSSGLVIPKGSAVRLCPVAETMGIAEGIETAMSAAIIKGIPTWAALNAKNLAAWTPPDGVKSVVIFGDCDLNFVGQQAAYTLAQRLAGWVDVIVRFPPKIGDWNDALISGDTAHAA